MSQTQLVEVTGATNDAPIYINPAHVIMVLANPKPDTDGSLVIFNLSVGTMEERAVRPEILQVKEELSELKLRLGGLV